MRKSIQFVLLLLIFCAGCKSIVPWPADRSHNGSYAGLLERWKETTNENGTMRMIMVHGMGGLGPDQPGYGDTFANGIAKALSLTRDREIITDSS